MNEETLLNILDQMEEHFAEGRAFVTDLGGGVFHAHVWLRQPVGPRSWIEAERRELYILRSNADSWIGAVLLMGGGFEWIQDGGDDLHGVLLAKFRGQGIMSKALRERILPHLASQGRINQRVTFEQDRIWAFLKKLGFRRIGDQEAVVSLGSFRPESLGQKDARQEPMEEVWARDRMRTARLLLHLVGDRAFHADTSLCDLRSEIQHLKKAITRLEGLIQG